MYSLYLLVKEIFERKDNTKDDTKDDIKDDTKDDIKDDTKDDKDNIIDEEIIRDKWCMGCQTDHLESEFMGSLCKINTIKNIRNNKYNKYNNYADERYDTYLIDGINVNKLISKEEFDKYINVSNRSMCDICYTYFKNTDMYNCDLDYAYMCRGCVLNDLITNHSNYMGNRPLYSNYGIQCTCREHEILISKHISEDVFNQIMTKIDAPKPKICYRYDCNGLLEDDICKKCHQNTCLICHEKGHTGDCDKEHIEALYSMMDSGGNNFKYCPNCKHLIFKSSGCSNQFCWNCSRVFDWETEVLVASFACSDYSYYDICKKALKKGYNLDNIDPTDFESSDDFNINILNEIDKE